MNNNAELILNIGCSQKVRNVQMKNLNRDLGGTKHFSIFLSDYSMGPWNLILRGELNQSSESGCLYNEMHSFPIDNR